MNENNIIYKKYLKIVQELEKSAPTFTNSLEIREDVDEDDFYIDATMVIDEYDSTYDHNIVDKILMNLEGIAFIKGTHGIRYLTLNLDQNSTDNQIKVVAKSLSKAQEEVEKYYKISY